MSATTGYELNYYADVRVIRKELEKANLLKALEVETMLDVAVSSGSMTRTLHTIKTERLEKIMGIA